MYIFKTAVELESEDALQSLLEDLPPIIGEVFSQIFMNSTTAAAVAAAAVAAPVALAAVAPPPLPMFPPQGLPQPTASGAPAGGGGGGGSLPTSAITVRKLLQNDIPAILINIISQTSRKIILLII